MKHKERIAAVLNGQPVDRVPVATWGHDFLREWSADELAAHTIERHRKYQYDFVKLNPRWTMFAEPWGNIYEPPVEQRFPRLTSKIVNSLDDIARIPQASASHPVFVEHISALERVVYEIGDDVDVLATIFSPLAVLSLLCGNVGEPLQSYAKQEPELVHAALAHITETLSQHVAETVDAGASGIFFAALNWTSLDICDASFYAEFGERYDLAVLQAAKDAPFNMMHVCGNQIALERFFDYPTQVLNWDNFGPGNMSLAEAAGRTSQVVAAGIPHRKIHKISKQALADSAADSLEGVGSNVMLVGGCGIGATVSDEARQSVTELAETLPKFKPV